MEEVAGRGAPPSQPPARSTPSPAAPDLEPSASATAAAASTSVDRPSRSTQPTAPAQGKYSGLALSIGPLPGAKPSTMSREAAAQPSAAPPPSLFRSMFARCAGEEQEQQAADAADALSIGPQPALLHGTRRPLAAGQLGHFRKVLMQSARPPFPSRHPSPALSRTCRPLSLASRAPHTRSPLTCAPDVSRSADQRAVESGHRRADQQADAGLGSGGREGAGRPQAPVLLLLPAFVSVPTVPA